jgi:hypothetical protein
MQQHQHERYGGCEVKGRGVLTTGMCRRRGVSQQLPVVGVDPCHGGGISRAALLEAPRAGEVRWWRRPARCSGGGGRRAAGCGLNGLERGEGAGAELETADEMRRGGGGGRRSASCVRKGEWRMASRVRD